MMNKKVIGILGLSAVALVGGTFAYFTQTAQIDNPFNTAKYSTVVTENFDPSTGDNWQPGSKVTKELEVHNFGDRAVVVKVEFKDIWKGSNWDKEVSGADALEIFQTKETDGLRDGDKSVVKKIFGVDDVNLNKWVEIDGAYYYKTTLKGNDSTGQFLSDVQLIDDVDMGDFEKYLYSSKNDARPTVTVDMSEWGTGTLMTSDTATPSDAKHTAVVTKVNEDRPGYSNASYTLSIKITTVQATKDAVEATFGEGFMETNGSKLDWALDATAEADVIAGN